MDEVNLPCDQAIFTSTRTPTGEGYRIIAASGGLEQVERQAITRSSPSHDALCIPDDGSSHPNDYGAAFYQLPSGRFCVAYSCYAGDEHTGRGGKRVYTHNVIVDEDGWRRSAYNPFAILRAMSAAGLFVPTLNPKGPLPEVDLALGEATPESVPDSFYESLTMPWRTSIVDALLDGESLIVHLADQWVACAEAFLMALPGPMRAEISFAAGLRFSVARSHRLSLVNDDAKVIKSRSTGNNFVYWDPATQPPPKSMPSVWAAFVERHWQKDEVATLSSRTSQPFSDVSQDACARIATLYDTMDRMDEKNVAELFELAQFHLDEPGDGIEARLAEDVLQTIQTTVMDKLPCTPWDKVKSQWQTVCALWRRSEAGCQFALPILEKILELAARVQPTLAAHIAFELNFDVPVAAAEHSHLPMIERTLTRLADWADSASDTELEGLPALYERWSGARPQCPIVKRLQARLTANTANNSAVR